MKKTIVFHSLYLLYIVLSASFYAQDFSTQPALKWKFTSGAPIVSSPIIEGNIVYFGSNDSTLYAVDLASGNEKWKFSIKGQVKSSPLVEENSVYFAGGDGITYSLDKNTGKVNWQFQTMGETLYKLYSYADYYHSSPVFADGLIYFGSGDGNIYALNAASGEKAWSYKTGEVVHSKPCIYNGKLYAGSFDGNLYALDLKDGRLVWKFKSVGHRFFPLGEMQGSPVAGDGLVFIGSRDYNLYAIDAEKGYCHWNRQFPLGWALALTVKDTVLYTGTSDDDLMLALDTKTGKEYWKTNVKFNIFGGAVFTQNMLYFGTLMGKLIGMERLSGEIKWSFNTSGYDKYHSEYFKDENNIVKNDFYTIVGSPEGYIKALHKLGAVFSTPIISGDLIVFTSTDGNAYCLTR